jgi:hypothetical protein
MGNDGKSGTSWFRNNQLKHGVARPTRYEVDFLLSGTEIPEGLDFDNVGTVTDPKLSKGVGLNKYKHTEDSVPMENTSITGWTPISVTLPSKSFVTIDEQWFGPVKTIPLCHQYSGDVIMSFMENEKGSMRAFFERWMNGVVNPYTNRVLYGSGVVDTARVNIHCLDMKNEKMGSYALHDAYVSDILPVNLGAGMYNDFMSITVKFQYKYYVYYR